jgi:FMN-dependent NADH-azoreductase
MKKVLHLNLYRKYFDQILKKEKTIEYRDITPYWSKRLEGRHYDVIKFRNGYRKDAPEMIVEYKGMYIKDSEYAIELGNILETKNVT